YYFFARAARPFRLMGWMFLVVFVVFLVAKGRGYYLAPAYPTLLAAGAVVEERWLLSLRRWNANCMRAATLLALLAGGVAAITVTLPIAPARSRWFGVVARYNGYFREEIGWPELVAEVAKVRDSLPADEIGQAAVLAANYGEAGAINMYGRAYGLPKAISGMNSYWARGYGDPPPQIVIVVGFSSREVNQFFTSCELAGHVTNQFH